jgi:cytoskeletal protein CcmA (bactofilin family)
MLNIFKKDPPKDLLNNTGNISSLARDGNNLFSDTLILLDERLSGNLFCAEKIVVEQNGILSGNITSKLCVVSGTINGNIVSSDQMEIKSTAIIKGNIQSALINIEPGAVINGSVTIKENTGDVFSNLADKIKEFSENEYLRDKPYAQNIEAAPNAGSVTLNWEFSSSEDLDKINLDKLNTDVQPGLELPELNWVFNSTDKVNKPYNQVKLIDGPDTFIPVAHEAVITPAEKKPAKPAPAKEENNQRWW